jgi:CotS family spore coat protein
MAEDFCAAWNYFGIDGRRAWKERGAQLCHTPAGRLRLAKTSDPPEVLRFAHGVKEHLAVSGFVCTDRYVTAPDGLPFAHIGTENYVLTHAPESRPIDFTNREETETAVRALARFHLAARGLDGPKAIPQEEIFRRGASTIAAAVKQVRKQKQHSDFDILFMQNAARYEERIIHAQQLLHESAYATLPVQLCHHVLKDEHIKIADGTVYLTSFTGAAENTPLHDLSLFLRHLSVKNDASYILEAYDQINPLPNGAEDVLAAMECYPADFIKIIEQYYIKKRTWIPGALIKRLLEEVNLEEVNLEEVSLEEVS